MTYLDYCKSIVFESTFNHFVKSTSTVCLNESQSNINTYFKTTDELMSNDSLLESILLNTLYEVMSSQELLNKLKNSKIVSTAMEKKRTMLDAATKFLSKQLDTLGKQTDLKKKNMMNLLRQTNDPQKRKDMKDKLDQWSKTQRESIQKKYKNMKTNAVNAYNQATRNKEGTGIQPQDIQQESVNFINMKIPSEDFVNLILENF